MKDEIFRMPTRVVMGSGCVKKHSGLFAGLPKRVAVITGKSSAVKSGALSDVTQVLEGVGIKYSVVDFALPNPDLENVEALAEEARKAEPGFIVAIGGGSAMDAAKAVAVLCVNDMPAASLFSGKAPNCPLPIYAIPTTAGTGSEVTPYSVLTVKENNMKQSFSDDRTFPVYAFLDHAYTASMDPQTARDTAFDAFSHAFEGYVSKRATRTADILAEAAMKLFFDRYEAILGSDYNDPVRETLIYMSMLAGMVISQTGTTALHSMGYSLTCLRDISHGRANGLLFKGYYDLLLAENRDRLAGLASRLGFSDPEKPGELIRALFPDKVAYMPGEAEKYAADAMLQKNVSYTPLTLDTEQIMKIFTGISE